MGDGYNIRQDVCYASAAREVVRRRIAKKFDKTPPDLQGSLPTDGVSIAITLQPDDSEDVLGLAATESVFGPAAPSRELDADDGEAHQRG